MFRGRYEPVARLREWRLPGPEREAARAERRVERQIRLERDNTETAERRAAALEAERRRYKNLPF
ncbi:MAG TPA: hypothetical protein VH418_12570 [Solirubrobacteraceae bacterium]